MIFRAFLLDVNEANCYVVGCEETGEALLVDAGGLDTRLVEFVREHGLKLSTLFVTHDHFDHTGGLAELLDRYPATLVGGDSVIAAHPCRRVGNGDPLRVGRIEGRVLSTPGHTPDGVSLVLPGMVFTGDALFAGSIGGTSSDRAKQVQIAALREQVLSLPGWYEIYPGHGPASTVEIERDHNPFFV